MNELNQTQTAEAILSGVIDSQAAQAGELVHYVECMKQYVRSARMMSRVCVAGAELGSESERDIQALSYLIGDIEAWLNYQDAIIQERFANTCLINVLLQDGLEKLHQSENQSE
jgi:hypothetical protein